MTPAAPAQTQWALIARRFARHRLARWSLVAIVLLYGMALFAEPIAPYGASSRDRTRIAAPPQPPAWSWTHGLHAPNLVLNRDPVSSKPVYTLDAQRPVPLGLLVRGEPYRLWGLIPWNVRLIGVDRAEWQRRHGAALVPTVNLLGADQMGQDILSRMVHGSRVSLSIGLAAIVVTFFLGVAIGGVSGYLGGRTDAVIQRIIDVINAFPQLPMWLALAALVPAHWSPLLIYFGITVALSLLGWTGLARVVRGKFLSLREEDHITAARLIGCSHARIIAVHLLPGFASHIIVSLTMAVPAMILGETALSFLGLGLRAPVVSWGVMLQDCMSMEAVAHFPWLLAPGLFIVLAVMAFNFLGDGLRDAADPYTSKA